MQEKYHLTKEQNIFLAKEELVSNIYNSALLEGINITYEDTKKVVMELLKNYIKCYDLNQEQIESLCTDFDILKEDMDILFKQTRNGVN